MKYDPFFSLPRHRKLEHLTVASQPKTSQYHHILHHSLPQNHTHLKETNFLRYSEFLANLSTACISSGMGLLQSIHYSLRLHYIYFSPLPLYIYNSFPVGFWS